MSANASDPTPTATVQITVTNPPTKNNLVVQYNSTKVGVASVGFVAFSNTVADLNIDFKVPGQLAAGVYKDSLTLSVCLDAYCAHALAGSPQTISIQYTVIPYPVPSLKSITPISATPGSGNFTLTANGTGFVNGATVEWNGNALTTTYVSSSELTAEIPATDVAAAGTSEVSVVNPSPGGGTSNALPFPIQYGKPIVNKLFPDAVMKGSQGFTLTIVGNGFGTASQVQWNGSARSTRFVSDTELTIQISANDVSSTGTATVTVLNPAPGSSSSPATFTIKPVTSDAVAFQIDPDHSGVMNFGTVSFPSQPAWTVDVSGPPSYALIADGKVFVTAQVNGSAQLIALDQATGALVWGPIVLSDAASAAYDAGSVFIVSITFATPTLMAATLMQAYDATTGHQEWSTQLSRQYTFSSGPTAVDGIVYTGGTDGTLYAVNETDGTIAWTQPVKGGEDSTPAVTTDGVYVTYPCQTYDFRPGTGELVWHDDDGCGGGGGATPVVANGVLYAPNGFAQYNGNIFNAETGTSLGSYIADNPPAITKNNGYFLQSGTLNDIALSNNTTVWSFSGDGNLVTSPIVINQYVIVGSSSGNLYALDRTTGQQVWKVNVGAAIPSGAGWGAQIPLSGLSAGHGLLIVPAGNSVIAYRLASN